MAKVKHTRCIVTDAPIPYQGYGRPPLYASEAIKRRADAERRKARRIKQRESRRASPL